MDFLNDSIPLQFLIFTKYPNEQKVFKQNKAIGIPPLNERNPNHHWINAFLGMVTTVNLRTLKK
jgi:hypothetical protein